MVIWFAFLFILILVACVCNILFPRKMWGLFKAWRFKNPETVEPSDLVIWWARISSTIGIVVIAGFGVVGFREYREDARCEKLLAEFEGLYETGGVPAVERRAHSLGLEVKDEGEELGGIKAGRILITDDGKPFATLSHTGDEPYCST